MRLPKFSVRLGDADAPRREVEQFSGFTSFFRKASADSNGPAATGMDLDLGQMGYDRFEVLKGQNIYIQSESERSIFADSGMAFEDLNTYEPAATDGRSQEKAQADNENGYFDEPSADLTVEGSEEVQATEPAGENTPIEAQTAEGPEYTWDHPEYEKEKESSAEEPQEGWFDDEPSDTAHISIEDLFGNVKRGSDGYVNTDVGVVDNGIVMPVPESEPETVHLEDFDAPVIRPVGLMEREGIVPEEAGMKDSEPESVDAVLEASVPQTEESIILLGAPAPTLSLAAPVYVPVAETYWEITEEASAAFGAFMTIQPEFPKTDKPWELSEEAVSAYGAFLTIKPEYETTEVPWEITEDAASAFGSYLSIRPEYPAEEVAWSIGDDAASAFGSYLALTPEYADPEIDWDLSDEAVSAFGSYLSIRPEYPAEEVAWSIGDDAASAYGAFLTIEPEYTAAEIPVPEWDVSDDAAVAYSDFKTLEADYFRQQFMAALPGTVAIPRMEAKPLEQRESEIDAIAITAVSEAVAVTSTADNGVGADVLSDPMLVKENIEIRPEPKLENGCEARTSRFVFKDGRLQKVPVEMAAPAADIKADFDMEYAPVPEIKEESFRAPLTMEEEQPIMKPKAAKLVAFGFGQSETNSGNVRFEF